jgi:transcriptional regulator with XRE-family HTH domain
MAWNLRRIRVRRGLSQERLAFDAGVDRSYVGGLERQEENPTVDILDRLARTLSVPIADLLVEPAKGSPPPQAVEEWPPTLAVDFSDLRLVPSTADEGCPAVLVIISGSVHHPKKTC